MRYIVIDAGKLEVRDEEELSLEKMQAIVGGYIEGIGQYRAEREGTVQMLVNEDGVMTNLPRNVKFRRVAAIDGVLRGPVLIHGADREGEVRGLTDKEIRCWKVVLTDRAPELLYFVM